jgi:hypothetical protein
MLLAYELYAKRYTYQKNSVFMCVLVFQLKITVHAPHLCLNFHTQKVNW